MGNNEAGIPSKPTKASSAVLEQNSAHPYPDWTAMQAYYGFGTNITPTHSSHPYVWPAPFLMSPFGAPYSIYQHGGVCSQSPDIDGVVTPIKSPKNIEPRVLDGSAASDVNGSEETELGSVSNAPSHSESEGRDSCNGRQKKNNRQAYHTGENRGASRGVAEENVARLPVPANPKLPVPVLMEEREGKREKRKQSNRESARRSRLRKQSEAEELAQKVESLVAENRALASEVSQLRQDAARLRLENSALQKKLKATEKSDAGNPVPSAVTENLLSRIESPPEEREKESLIILGQLL